MSYTALYRKFRPDTFDEVKGQEHIVTTLKNQIKADRLGHAYLFCGTRGTGKTTIAKILAKSVNCENPKDGSPCNECPACRAISAGASMNVIEIDAASNNGVDNIREIRDEVQYPPTEGRYKVYIIDEVHMLSIGAFNALLKTLEEPPSYVIFILATTEAHKIPVTILSRCQRYDFKRISIETIADRIRELADREQVDIEDRAVRYIAKAADGAMRDALSLMDQCIAFYIGEKLTYDNVLEVLGAVDTAVFGDMLRCILADNTAGAIEKLEEVIMSGRDLTQFITDFTWYLRNLLLVMTSDDEAQNIVDVTSERLEALKEEAAMTNPETLMRYIRILSELSNQMKFATSKRVLAEVAIVKLTKPMMENDIGSLLGRISAIEKKIETGEIVRTVYEQPQALAANIQVTSDEEKKSSQRKLEIAVHEDVQYVVNNWDKILRHLSGMEVASLKAARLCTKGDNTLIIQFTEIVPYTTMSEQKRKDTIHRIIGEETGKDINIDMKLLQNGEKQEDNFVEVLKNKINMENIELVEEDI